MNIKMTGVETAISVASTVNGITKEHQKGFVQYFLVNFLGEHYKKYLTNSLVLQAEAGFNANKEIIENFQSQPTPALQLMEKEGEIDYKNMAGVLMLAAGKIDEDAEGNIDPDKFKRLKDLSKEFSSEEMQDYVAGVIAGEYNKSGTYSLQTIEIIRSLSRNEFSILKKYKSLLIKQNFMFSSSIGSIESITRLGVNFDEFHLLVSLGIFSGQGMSSGLPNHEGYTGYLMDIGGKKVSVSYESERRITGIYSLTLAGKEIMTLIEEDFSDVFFEYNKEQLLKLGITVQGTQ